MSEKKSFVFVFVGSKVCGACLHFKKNYWEATKKELEKIPELKVIEYETPTIGSSLPPSSPPDLARFVEWYPTFVLTSNESWERGDKIEGLVFNGKESSVTGRWEPVKVASEARPRESASIVAWVKEGMLKLSNSTGTAPSFSSMHNGINKLPAPQKSNKSKEAIYTPSYCKQGFVPLY